MQLKIVLICANSSNSCAPFMNSSANFSKYLCKNVSVTSVILVFYYPINRLKVKFYLNVHLSDNYQNPLYQLFFIVLMRDSGSFNSVCADFYYERITVNFILAVVVCYFGYRYFATFQKEVVFHLKTVQNISNCKVVIKVERFLGVSSYGKVPVQM